MKLTKQDLKNIYKLIESTGTGIGQIDDGPNVFFATKKGYENWAKKNGQLINFVLDKFYIKQVKQEFDAEGEPEWGNNYNRKLSRAKQIMDKFADVVGFKIYNYLINKEVEDDVTGDYVNNANEQRYFKEIGLDRIMYERKLY